MKAEMSRALRKASNGYTPVSVEGEFLEGVDKSLVLSRCPDVSEFDIYGGVLWLRLAGPRIPLSHEVEN